MVLPTLYCVERVLPFPIEVLWEAWTSSAALQEWYHPQDLKVVAGSATSEPRVDGKWSVGIDASAHGFVPYFYGRYLEVTPLERLRHTMHYTESAEDFAVGDETTEFHEVIITFSEISNGTEVTFTQIGTLPEGQAEQAKTGMESYFDSLGTYLEARGNEHL
jgi:uncharacterized protein YndB with AHSA1/START domain